MKPRQIVSDMDSYVPGRSQDEIAAEFGLKKEDIIYIETSRHKNFFYTKTQVYSIYKKLSELEEELEAYGFVRVHLSFLVNMQYIEKISSYVLWLANGKEISVPKSRYAEVKKKYAAYREEAEAEKKAEEETE